MRITIRFSDGEETMTTMTANLTATFQVEASAVISARPEELYAIIADYKVGHPAILPKPEFTELTVEKGGVGAGTVLQVAVKIWGRVIRSHQIVSEPEPGRTLVETDLDTGQYTTFTFEPVNGSQTRLTITSVFPAKPGFAGWLEKIIQNRVLRGLYERELDNLAAYVASNRSAK
jgi:hypothetical protein